MQQDHRVVACVEEVAAAAAAAAAAGRRLAETVVGEGSAAGEMAGGSGAEVDVAAVIETAHAVAAWAATVEATAVT